MRVEHKYDETRIRIYMQYFVNIFNYANNETFSYDYKMLILIWVSEVKFDIGTIYH